MRICPIRRASERDQPIARSAERNRPSPCNTSDLVESTNDTNARRNVNTDIYRGSYEIGKAGKRWGAYTLLSWRRRDADRCVSERTSARVNEVQRGSFEYE